MYSVERVENNTREREICKNDNFKKKFKDLRQRTPVL